MRKLTPLELRPAQVRITEEEILADLTYPARRARPLKARAKARRR